MIGNVLNTDDSSTDCDYVDLLLNPERYTGYKGDSPHRIWNSIYRENCFKLVFYQFKCHLLVRIIFCYHSK